MEQDQLLGRHQPLTAGRRVATALLLAAHGERTPGAANESVMRIARAIGDRGIVSEVTVGFINGTPTIADALGGVEAGKLIVYPLFASNGYFTRDRLVQLIDEADRRDCEIQILPPLGLDPGLGDVAINYLEQVSRRSGIALTAATAVLLAHGSRRNPASREATEWIAGEIAKRKVCGDVAVAFLEEPPHLEETVRSIAGPAIVVGLFSGDGLHGARDAPRLVARLGRPDVVYSGVIGHAPGIDELVGRAVLRALAGES